MHAETAQFYLRVHFASKDGLEEPEKVPIL